MKHHRVFRGQYRPSDRAPFDEAGTPDRYLDRCATHDVLYRTGTQCLECVRQAGPTDHGYRVTDEGAGFMWHATRARAERVAREVGGDGIERIDGESL